jgi:hypothetical protein
VRSLQVSKKEYDDIVRRVKEKIIHPAYNGKLKKYFIKNALSGKFQLSDLLLSTIHISEALEKRQKKIKKESKK